MEKITNLVVGAGISGAVIARQIAAVLQQPVTVIDSREHIAGNIYDYHHPSGITVHKYGPHIFHTQSKEVWDYLSQFTAWHYFFLKPNVWIDNIRATLPFNLNTLHQVLPASLANRLEQKLIEKYGYNVKVPILTLQQQQDADLKFLAAYIYEKVFKNYTLKQWGISAEEIDPSVMARVPVYISRDDGYFQDKYQAIPAQGYTAMVEKMLYHPLITVRLKTPFQKIKDHISYERLFYTGPIDEFFEYNLGPLPYRSLRFEVEQKKQPYYQPAVVTNYPNNFDFTRICEHKYFLNEQADTTVISVEYPQEFKVGENDPYYPIANEQTAQLYERYLQQAKKLPGVYFLGRLGDYKYYNMDQAVTRALHLADTLK